MVGFGVAMRERRPKSWCSEADRRKRVVCVRRGKPAVSTGEGREGDTRCSWQL